ncbi:hypothetical protein D3C81_1708070 [compost metagenome]
MSQSALNNAQLADLINWIMREDGMAGKSMPANYQPYTEQEVAAIRKDAMLNLPATRAGLIAQMRAKGIAIDDGVSKP